GWSRVIETDRCMRAVESIMTREMAKDRELDQDPYLLGVPNGVVNLRDGSLMDGQPSQWITRTTAAKYDPTAQSKRWEQFLMEIFRDKDGKDRPHIVDWVWRAVGYSITGDVSKQCWLL